MANFKYNTKEEKQRLKVRALALKPRLPNVVATAKGWAQPRPNGTLELLVSFGGLDELLGDVSVDLPEQEIKVPAPIKVEKQEQPEVAVVEPKEAEKQEEQPKVEPPKKKGGRPKGKGA